MKVMLHGYFGYGNIGDEAILEALLNELAYNNEAIVLSVNPDYTKRLHGVKAIKERLLSIAFWKNFLLSSRIVFAGGGRYGSPTLRRMSLLILLAKLFRKSVEVRSAGIYSYKWSGEVKVTSEDKLDLLTRLLLYMTFNRLDLLSVRDKSSYVLLKRLGIRNVRLEEDLAIKLRPRYNSVLIELVKKKCYLRPIVGVNLRTLKPEIRATMVSEVAKFLDLILQDGFCPIFIPFGYGSFKGRFFDDDYIIYNEVVNAMTHRLHALRGEYRPSEILSLFREFKVFIGMRFHSIMFAYMMNVPTIALVYDTKVKDFVEAYKWPVKAIDLRNLSAQRLYKAFRELVNNSGIIE
ncbi:MAG: polysaccharide pyruvyl transferase family protein [Sulfolobales archaeon]